MIFKYVRIQGRERSCVTKYPKGIFSLGWNLIRDGVMSQDENELFISVDEWFKENLPEPEPCRNHEKVITFFKSDTTAQMLEKLGPVMTLLEKYNRPYDIVFTNYVGTVVHEDRWQVAVTVSGGQMI